MVTRESTQELLIPSPYTSGESAFQNAFSEPFSPSSIASGDLLNDIQQAAGAIFSGKTGFNNTETGYRLGIDPSDQLEKFYIGNTTAYLNWTGAALTIAGTLTASSINIPDTTTANSFHVDTSGNAWWGATTLGAALASVLNTGAATFTNISITGGSISGTTTVGIGNVNLAARGWTQTSVFSVTDADTVAWGAGVFTSADGTSYSIGAGNTGNMAAPTYVYLDVAVSTTAYQSTTTATTAVGAGKVLIAKAENGTGEATFQVFGGIGGQNIDASSIVANSITANELATSIIYTGAIVISTSGLIRSGQTDYDTGTGWWIGSSLGTAKLSIGNSAGNKLTWDGSALTIVGTIGATATVSAPLVKTYTANEALSAGDAVILGTSNLCPNFVVASGQYLSITDASQTGLDITGDISIEAWINVNTFGASNNEERVIVSKWNETANRSYIFTVTYQGHLRLIVSTDGTGLQASITDAEVASAVIASTGTWYHVAVTYRVGVREAIFYVNGVAQTTTYNAQNAASIFNSTAAFAIGGPTEAGGSGANTLYGCTTWDGQIDEVRIYNSVVSAAQIAANQLERVVTGAVGLWHLENVLTDSSGNGNTLTNNNSTTFQPAFFLMTGDVNGVWKGDADFAGFTNPFIGFSTAAYSSGQTAMVVIQGEATVLGLTQGKQYYLSNTAGGVSTSAGTNTRKVGIATSTTTMLVTNIW